MPPEVKVRLIVEGTPEALAAFRSVQQQAQSSGRAAAAGMAPLNASLSAMKSLLGQLGLAAGLVATLGKIVGEVKAAVEVADKLGETAERLTTAVKDFVPLALQAKTAGVELDVLEQKMARFAKQLWELRAGNPEVVAGFRAIGLSAKSFDGRDLAQSFTIALRALGQLRDSYQKGAVAQLVFAKGAEDLIPLANDVAQNGIDPLKVKIGELFGERNISDIRTVRDELDLLNYALKGIIVSGIGPFIIGQAENVRLITNTLIELNGLMENFTVLAPLMSGAWRGFASWLVPARIGIEKAHQEVREFGLELQKLYDISKALVRGDVAGARKADLIAEAKLMASQAVHAEKLKEIWESAGPPAGASLAKQEPPEPPAKLRKPTGATDAQLKEKDQAALQAAQAHNAALEAEAKRAYDAGEKSLQAYYTARRDTIENNLTAELELLIAEWKRAQKIQNPAQRDAALKAIGSQTDEATAKADKARTELDASYLDERTKLEKTLADLADKRRAAEEQEHQSKLREIAETQEAERKALVQLGVAPEVATAQAASDAATLTRAEEFRHQLATARTELETLTSSGTLSDVDVERFNRLATALEAMAAAIGPEAVKAVQDFVHSKDEAVKAAKATVELTDYGQAAAGALAQSFTDVGDEINSASAALLNFIRLLGNAILQVAATRLAEKLVSYIPGFSTKKARGGLISGPGTGTSDSIPAWLSTGEYVVRAAAVRQPGVLPLLEQVNRAPRPAPYQLQLPNRGDTMLRRYAEGGLVLGQRATSVTAHADVGGTIYVAPAPGAVVTEMRTPAGQKVFLELAAKNARTLRRIAGTG